MRLTFFYCTTGPHTPRCFPTRRSSDLERAVGREHHVARLQIAMHHAPLVGGMHRAGQDRKSTRLNSSHMSMSDAVFCLKNKDFQVTMPEIGTSRAPRRPLVIFTMTRTP